MYFIELKSKFSKCRLYPTTYSVQSFEAMTGQQISDLCCVSLSYSFNYLFIKDEASLTGQTGADVGGKEAGGYMDVEIGQQSDRAVGE